MKILEYEVEDLDTFDPDVLEKIESETAKVLDTAEKSKQEEKKSSAIRMQCEAVVNYIDALWGEGTAEKVFNAKTNLIKSLKAFEEIQLGIKADTDMQSEEINKIINKYSPNRAVSRRIAAIK